MTTQLRMHELARVAQLLEDAQGWSGKPGYKGKEYWCILRGAKQFPGACRALRQYTSEQAASEAINDDASVYDEKTVRWQDAANALYFAVLEDPACVLEIERVAGLASRYK